MLADPNLMSVGYGAWLLLYAWAAWRELRHREAWFPRAIWPLFLAWDLVLSTMTRATGDAFDGLSRIAPFLSVWPLLSALVVVVLALRRPRRHGVVALAAPLVLSVGAALVYLGLFRVASLVDAVIASGYGVLLCLLALEFRRMAARHGGLWRAPYSGGLVVFHAVRAVTPSLILLGSGLAFVDYWSMWVWVTYLLAETVLTARIVGRLREGAPGRRG